MFVRSHIGRGVALVGGASVVVLALGACSGSSDSSSSSSPTPTQSSATATSTATSSGASCTAESLQSVLPNGAKVTSFNCSGTGGGEIAAVRFNPGPTVQFLKLRNGTWEPINADEICGTASAGLDPKVLAYCSGTETKSPTKSASKSATPTKS